MENLEQKTIMSRIKAKAKKHPWILPVFVAANIAYFPVSIAWKAYLGKVIYDHYKNKSEAVRIYQHDEDFGNSLRNKFEKIKYVDLDYNQQKITNNF